MFSSPISSSANCTEYRKELPNSLYSPLKGTNKPILSLSSDALPKVVQLKISINKLKLT